MSLAGLHRKTGQLHVFRNRIRAPRHTRGPIRWLVPIAAATAVAGLVAAVPRRARPRAAMCFDTVPQNRLGTLLAEYWRCSTKSC